MNSVFAVAVALWLSRVFHKNYLRGGRSKRTTVFRGFFVLLWGCLLLGVGLLLSVPYYVLPILDKALLSVNTFSGFSAQFDLSVFGWFSCFKIVWFYYSCFHCVWGVSCYGMFMCLGAWFSAKWSLGTVKRISQGCGCEN